MGVALFHVGSFSVKAPDLSVRASVQHQVRALCARGAWCFAVAACVRGVLIWEHGSQVQIEEAGWL